MATIWHACFELRTSPGNDHHGYAGGAFADCFVHSHDPQLAELVMTMLLAERHWQIVAVKKDIGAVDPSLAADDTIASDIEYAREQGHAFRFRVWPMPGDSNYRSLQ